LQLIQGLSDNGLKVKALGSMRRRPSAEVYRICWPSALLTQLIGKPPLHGSSLQPRLLEQALAWYDRFASKHWAPSRCLWGWCGHHLEAFKTARAQGIPCIVEAGSSHARWQFERLEPVYAHLGHSFDNQWDRARRERNVKEYESADWISVPSRFVARTFMEHGVSEEKLFVNAFGADLGFWSQATRKQGDRPFTVIYVAGINARKGVHLLLSAWEKAGLEDSRLLMVGGVSPEVQSHMDNPPTGVEVLGIRNHHEIRALYEESDVYILPSLEEGQARSVFEVMAAGVPVIVTEETGATDIMVDGEDGFVVSSNDEEALVDVLRRAHRERDRMAERGVSAQRRVDNYTWKAYGDRAATFLKSVLS
ncbi:MAG: glycosyltransferase family 4 protein, partial [Verrucomicrobiota bacterium]